MKPILLLLMSLGAIRPNAWTLFLMGTTPALITATVLKIALPRYSTRGPYLFGRHSIGSA